VYFVSYRKDDDLFGARYWSEYETNGISYGIDWETGLSWSRTKGCTPQYYSSFQAVY